MAMAKYVIQTDKGAPPLGAYSQGWRAGDFIFVTGTGPIGPDGKVKGTTIEEQTDQAIDNIEAILEADGATLENIVKATVHLSDANLFPLLITPSLRGHGEGERVPHKPGRR
jgi:2-iminobutanoate/2-iminopropanoate deaminase